MLERLKGRTLDVFAKEELFDQLGMMHTSYIWQKEYERLAVYGFRERGPQRDTSWSVRCNAAYSLRTSSEEFTKFLQWFLRGADLTPEWQKKMFTEYAKVPTKTDVPGDSRLYRNLGWVTEDSDEFGKIRYHGGEQRRVQGHGDHDPGAEDHALLLLQRRHPLQPARSPHGLVPEAEKAPLRPHGRSTTSSATPGDSPHKPSHKP